jgi:hypothetical protein
MFVGSFEADLEQFPRDVNAAVEQFNASGVTNLLIDVTNNPGWCIFSPKCCQSLTTAAPGGFLELGYFLYEYLGTESVGYPYVLWIQATSAFECISDRNLQGVPIDYPCQSVGPKDSEGSHGPRDRQFDLFLCTG